MDFFNWTSFLNRLVRRGRRRPSSVKLQKRTHRPVSRIQFEELEDRCVPYTAGQTFNENFISQLYPDLLNRNVDPTGLTFWSGQLTQGQSIGSVVLSIESSPEYKLDEVDAMYQTLLNRQVDTASAGFWEGIVQKNGVEAAEASIAGSQEFFNDAGGANAGFLSRLYKTVLNRPLDPAGSSFFSAQLASGTSRTTVAFEVLTSPEYRTDLVESYYERFLHRSADSSGLSFWVGQLESGASDQEVIAGIASSGEYYKRAPNAPTILMPSAATTVSTATFDITGTAENGALVQINSNGAVVASEQLNGNQSDFSITVPLTANVANNFTATATNDFGTVSAPVKVPTITSQTSPPTVALTTTATSVSNSAAFLVTATFGSDVSGFTTSDVTVTNGTANQLTGSGKSYTFYVLPTADGVVTISVPANVVDKNTASNTLSITSQRADPVVTVNPLTTNNTTPTLSGTVSQTGSTVSVSVNGQTIAATVSGNAWTATVPTALAPGSYTISATATDQAGNSSTSTSTNGLVINTTLPTVTINSQTDTTTSTPTITGTVSEAGSTVSVTVGGQTFTATVTGTAWSATVPTSLANGTYDVLASATDTAGNVGSASSPGGLIVALASQTGLVVTANPNTGNSTTPTLTGTVSDPLATVTVTAGGDNLTATVTGNVWSVIVSPPLTAGAYDIGVSAIDGANNDSTTLANGLVINTTAPTVSINTSTATTATPTITGTVGASTDTVSITVGGQTIKATVTGTTWSATVPTALANGTYAVTATAADTAGNTGSSNSASGLVVNVASTNVLPFSLTDNAWQTLASGVRTWDVVTGTGATAATGDSITVNYIGYLTTSSTPFNNSYTSGSPFTATLNTSGLIAGWVDGIPGMKVGGERRLDIPADLAYGANPPAGSGIPANAELVFDITLISVS